MAPDPNSPEELAKLIQKAKRAKRRLMQFKPDHQIAFLDKLRRWLGEGCAHCGSSQTVYRCAACNRRTCQYCTDAYNKHVAGHLSEAMRRHAYLNDAKMRYCQPCTYSALLDSLPDADQFLQRKLPTATQGAW